MILNAVIGFFKAVFGFIVKAAAWLLFALGLWLPCLYAVIFLIVCAFSATSFNSVLPQFFVGLLLSFFVGAALSYYIHSVKRRHRKEAKRGLKATHVKKTSKADKKADEERQNAPYSDPEYYDDRERNAPYDDREYAEPQYSAPQYSDPQYREPQYREPQYREPQYREPYPEQPYAEPAPYEDTRYVEPEPAIRPEPSGKEASGRDSIIKPTGGKPVYDFRSEAELHGKYFEDEKKSRLGDSTGYDYEQGAKKRLERLTHVEEEPPLIFRSRADKNIYICEYGDRFEYFEKTPWGEMKLIDVRYKRAF